MDAWDISVDFLEKEMAKELGGIVRGAITEYVKGENDPVASSLEELTSPSSKSRRADWIKDVERISNNSNRMSVAQMLASSDKHERMIGHILTYYGKV